MDEDDDGTAKRKDVKEVEFEVHHEDILKVREVCKASGYPLLEEYDFKNDSHAP